MMGKITTCLWFGRHQARAADEFYSVILSSG